MPEIKFFKQSEVNSASSESKAQVAQTASEPASSDSISSAATATLAEGSNEKSNGDVKAEETREEEVVQQDGKKQGGNQTSAGSNSGGLFGAVVGFFNAFFRLIKSCINYVSDSLDQLSDTMSFKGSAGNASANHKSAADLDSANSKDPTGKETSTARDSSVGTKLSSETAPAAAPQEQSADASAESIKSADTLSAAASKADLAKPSYPTVTAQSPQAQSPQAQSPQAQSPQAQSSQKSPVVGAAAGASERRDATGGDITAGISIGENKVVEVKGLTEEQSQEIDKTAHNKMNMLEELKSKHKPNPKEASVEGVGKGPSDEARDAARDAAKAIKNHDGKSSESSTPSVPNSISASPPSPSGHQR